MYHITTRSIAAAALAALTMLAAAAVSAAAPATPKPAGPIGLFRITPGVYASAGTECKAASDATTVRYNGRGIDSAQARACQARLRTHRGRTYVIDQSCIDTGTTPAPRAVERQTITVRDAHNFTLSVAGRETGFHHCPLLSLPDAMRAALKQ